MADQAPEATPFNNDAAPAAEQTPAVSPTTDTANPEPAFQIPQTVAELIGDGKKYSTVEKALEALVHSQKHIEKLEGENANFKMEIDKVKTAEELLEEIKATANTSEPTSSAPQIDEGMIDRIVEAKITAKEHAATAKQNVDTVITRMTKEYGDASKAEEVYIAKAKELGLSVAAVNDMAAKSPTAVFSMFGLTKHEAAPAGKLHSDVNLEPFSNQSQPPAKPKSVMGGAKQNEILDAWKAAAPKQE
jgi:hypothetical protein